MVVVHVRLAALLIHYALPHAPYLAMAPSDDPYSTSDRARLLQGTATLEDGSRRLQDSQRIALESEEMGTDILRTLRGQREQIENSRDVVRSHSSSRQGDGVLRVMISAAHCGHIHRPRKWDAEEDDTAVRHL